jgi:hypothetical protein
MNRFPDKLKQYPLAAASGVLFIGCLLVLFLRVDLVSNLAEQESELESRIRVINQNVRNSQELEPQLEALLADVASMDERLFRRSERAINTNFFYSFENTVDIVISSVSQLAVEDPASTKGGPHELKLHSAILYDISLQGAFEKILEFIYELYRVDSLIRVSHFSVDKAQGKDAESSDLIANFRVAVLARKDQKGK